MEWLLNALGSNGSGLVRNLLTFAVIFVVLAGIVLLVRRLFSRGRLPETEAGAVGRRPRLGIVDVYELDQSRQLILLRRDNVEHLLLVGGPNDVIVESGIERSRIGTGEPSFATGELAGPRIDQPATLPGPRIEPSFEIPARPDFPKRPEPVEAQGGETDLHVPDDLTKGVLDLPEFDARVVRTPMPPVEPRVRPDPEGKTGLEPDVLKDMSIELDAVLSGIGKGPTARLVEPVSAPAIPVADGTSSHPATPANDAGRADAASGTAGKPAAEEAAVRVLDELHAAERSRQPVAPARAPAPNVSPFGDFRRDPNAQPTSVEEIEAEFARLLGRSAGRG